MFGCLLWLLNKFIININSFTLIYNCCKIKLYSRYKKITLELVMQLILSQIVKTGNQSCFIKTFHVKIYIFYYCCSQPTNTTFSKQYNTIFSSNKWAQPHILPFKFKNIIAMKYINIHRLSLSCSCNLPSTLSLIICLFLLEKREKIHRFHQKSQISVI